MKKLYFYTSIFFGTLRIFFILTFLFFYTILKCQPAASIYNAPHLFCGSENESTLSEPFFPHNGDTLKVLVVFCNFPNGNYERPGSSICDYWPASNYLQKPSWADSIICPTTTNVWNRSLTGLYRDASRGSFWLIGDVYPDLYVFENEINYYSNSSRKIGFAVRELLENIDSDVNYADYDKFDPNDLDHDNNKREPDGIVDFIFINFRFNNTGSIDPSSYTGIDALGGRDNRFGSGVSEITLDNKRILATFPGSGCLYEMNTPWDLGIPSHEFGQHYTYGGIHNTIMGAYNINGGGIASAYDREYLGWNSSASSPNTNLSTTLDDYITTGNYIKIQQSNYTIYLENRTRVSYYASLNYRNWKWLSTDPKYPNMPDSGLVIYLNTGYRQFDIQSANGNWNWAKCPTNNKYKVEFFSSTFNHFQENSLNRFYGESTFDIHDKYALNLECEQIAFLNSNIDKVTYMGINGDSNTCFDVGYNEVYSPWSNPPLPIYNSNDSLTIEITGRNSNGSLSLNIFFTNILGASPSKPQGLKVGKNYVGGGFNPKLSWNRNLEPDLMNYIVYRGYVSSPGVEPSSYDSIANTTDTSYVDEELFLYESGSSPCYFISRYSYRISAVDNTNRKSVKSEKATIAGYYSVCDPYGDNILQQYNSNSENIIELDEFHNLNEYKLFDNYPNPFNPITKILFDLPEATSISLKIYNILGREVETLIDDNRQKGRYSILFNATNFPSGIYYYKLQTNNFTCVKKMILIK